MNEFRYSLEDHPLGVFDVDVFTYACSDPVQWCFRAGESFIIRDEEKTSTDAVKKQKKEKKSISVEKSVGNIGK